VDVEGVGGARELVGLVDALVIQVPLLNGSGEWGGGLIERDGVLGVSGDARVCKVFVL